MTSPEHRGKEIKALAVVFSTAFILRLMPELWEPSFPVGYDIPFYAIGASHFVEEGPLRMLVSPFLMSSILWAFYIMGLNLYIVLKIFAPVLYGFMMASFYTFLRRALDWGVERSTFCATICALQPMALRISWDLLKMELGLAVLFFFLANFRKWERENKWALISFSELLTVFSHQLPAILMFMFLAYELNKRRAPRAKILISALPAALVFSLYLLSFTGVITPPSPPQHRSILWLKTPYNRALFPRNYFLEKPFRSGNWADVALYVPLTFLTCFALLLVFAPLGLRSHGFLDIMSIWLVIASFSVIACPWAYPFVHFFRWMLMMVFPLAIYATDGAFNLAKHVGRREVLETFLILNTMIGIGYANGFPYAHVIPPVMEPYMPDRMTYSTIELSALDDCKACICWLNSHAENNSVLVVEHRFLAWAILWLDERISIAAYEVDVPLDDVELWSVISAYEHIYVIWYSYQIPNWRNLKSLKLFNSDDIAIYEIVMEG